MTEYIEREAIMEFPIRKDRCDKEHANEHFIFGIESVLEYVENLPAADVAPVVRGRWVLANKAYDKYKCSNCGALDYIIIGQKYCRYCGAKMDGGDNTER